MAPYDDTFVRKYSEGYFSEADEPNTYIEHVNNNTAVASTERLFANQPLDLSEISCYGFDMDYTLAEYISPQFDELGCRLAMEWMVDQMGYPQQILDNIKYDHHFPVRGLWFDREFGNLLKVNQFGKILQCFHGFKKLSDKEIAECYPGMIQKKDDKRIFVMNTLFNLPETFLVAALIDYYDVDPSFTATEDGLGWVDNRANKVFTFRNLFQDIRTAIDDIHLRSMKLKNAVIESPDKYIRKDPRLSPLLLGIRTSGRKSFLLTNSDWRYTSHVMKYLLGDTWYSLFDLIVVDACKPKFFSEGTTLKVLEDCVEGCNIYSGGNHDQLTSMLETQGHKILYCGDHLHADIIKCRKMTSWKTILIVPELNHELKNNAQDGLLSHIAKLENLLANNPKLTDVKCRLHEAVTEYDQRFSKCGSLFRSGTKLSYFGSMVKTWSEVYTSSVGNIAGYCLDTNFIPNLNKLAHEEEESMEMQK